MQDADLFMTTVFFHGLFEDLPQLRVAIAHSGTTWVPLALEKSETYLWLGGRRRRAGLSRAGRGLGAPSGAHLVRQLGAAGWPDGQSSRRQGGLGLAISQPRHRHPRRGPPDARGLRGRESTIERLLGGYAAEIFGLPVLA